MDISNINSSANQAIRSAGEVPNRIARAENNERREPIRDRKVDEGQLFKALEKTLSDSGLAPSASSRPAVATASQANDLEIADAATAQNAQQALPAFLSALFQSLNPGNGNVGRNTENGQALPEDSATAVRGRNAYEDLGKRLQNLSQSLGQSASNGDSASSQSADLETSFRNLALALQGKTSPATTPQSAPDLQSFLKTLAQNLNSAGSRLDSAGNLINTEA